MPEIDGLRAIAVLAVAVFHYFQGVPEYFPYGAELLPWASYGEMGVALFFVISGFVITLSLHSRPGVLEFLSKRFFRLWPALAVCSLITFLFMHTVPSPYSMAERAGGFGFLPSWTFTSQHWWAQAGFSGKYIDRVYWTLSVEVRFYVWSIAVFSICGRRMFAGLMPLLLLGTQFVTALLASNGAGGASWLSGELFVSGSAHYFAAGIVFAGIYADGIDLRRFVLLLWSLGVALALSEDAGGQALNAAIFLLVAACAWRWRAASLLAAGPLVWLGLCSYPVYLLHNNIGVTLISLLPEGLPPGAYFLLTGLVFCGILFLARIVHETVETASQTAIAAYWRRKGPEKMLSEA